MMTRSNLVGQAVSMDHRSGKGRARHGGAVLTITSFAAGSARSEDVGPRTAAPRSGALEDLTHPNGPQDVLVTGSLAAYLGLLRDGKNSDARSAAFVSALCSECVSGAAVGQLHDVSCSTTQRVAFSRVRRYEGCRLAGTSPPFQIRQLLVTITAKFRIGSPPVDRPSAPRTAPLCG